jgi:tetratricopeptide (TPR) repeat protein
MSTYLGNPSLSTAVKDRVVATFQQALALYRTGRTDEVIAGCGLILQMDPLFDPARKLLEKSRNPSSPIDVDTLVPTASADDALRQAREALTARDYGRVIQITTEILTEDLMNDDARILGDQAREKMEAAPFVEQFLKKCQQHLAEGNVTAAKADLEKARALDGDHPAVAQMEQMISGRGGAPAAAPAAPKAPAAAPSFSFDGGTSFVVDNPAPASTRGAAQASDFGFTFEEEKPAAPAGGFSFDSPAQPAAAPADAFSNFSFGAPAATPAAPSSNAPFAGGFSFDSPAPAAGGFSFDAPSSAASKPGGPAEFDFSTASIETSPDDQRKIDQYLSDGDRAFEGGDYQQAIDLWSRIFLIDVTNEVASERIERAKAKRREAEQQAETFIAEAVQAYDRKDHDSARKLFANVLRIDPNNRTAADYMERLADTGMEGGAAGYETPYVAPPAEKYDIFADDELSGSYETPPDPDEAPAPAAKPSSKKSTAVKSAPAKAKSQTQLPMGLIGAILAAAILLGGGWYAYSKFMSKPAYDPAATQAIFTQAQSLAAKGKYDQAIAMLQDVKPDDPQHDRALNLIADLQHKKTQAAEMIDGRPAAVVYQEALANGKAAFDAHDFDAAKKQFELALRVKALPPDMKVAYDTASQQVAKLDAAKTLFSERKYADAITNLQALAQQDPENKNIQRMLTDAHFNLGATSLQEAKTAEAVKEFDEVLKVDPSDELAKRSRELAVRYNGEDKDLLYRIYVKYLPLRQ